MKINKKLCVNSKNILYLCNVFLNRNKAYFLAFAILGLRKLDTFETQK